MSGAGWRGLPPDWPFDVRRLPFFYGWVIWALSTVGFVMSIPGQTMGMAVFTDTFIDAFGLSRTQLSLAYFIGTLGSATLLPRAGRLYDRMGARLTSAVAAALLGLVLLVLAGLDELVEALAGAAAAWPWYFAGVVLCYFGVRLAGQGVLTSASRNILLVWFERRRGLVSGARGILVTLAFSSAPLMLAALIERFGWRGALLALALACGVVFPLVAICLLRDSPESCGVRPDGYVPVTGEVVPEAPRGLVATLGEARRTPQFWLYSLGLGLHSLFVTAITFHIVALFAESGRGSAEAFGYFLPAAAVSVSVNLLASWLADGRRLQPFLAGMLLALAAGTVGLLALAHDWGYWLTVAGLGTGGGLWGVLANLAFIRHFGRPHLGEISGLNMTITVVGSAIGPVTFSLAQDLSGSFHAALYVCLALAGGLAAAALLLPLPEPELRP